MSISYTTTEKDPPKNVLPHSILYNSGRGKSAKKEWNLSDEYDETVSRFINSLVAKSPHTKAIYDRAVRHFFRFLQDRWGAPEVEQFNREHAESWARFLIEESGYHPSSIGLMVQSARVMCTRLVDTDWLESNPFEHVKELPKAAAPDYDILQPEDIQAMYNVSRKEANVWGKRDAALIAVLYYGGLRRAELLNIAADDIDFGRGVVHVKRGKGGDPRTVGLHRNAMSALERFMGARRKYVTSLSKWKRELLDDRPIWLSMKGGSLGEMGLGQMLRMRAKQAGVTRPVSPHAFRHASATKDAEGPGEGEAGMSEMEMRSKYGWSATSNMPTLYSRQTLKERAVTRSQQVRGDDGIRM